MAAKKRKPLTAQQRVKRSQNAKKRLRGVNGRFLDGLRASGALQAAQEGRGHKDAPYGTSPSFGKEAGAQIHSDAQRLVRNSPEQAAERLAYYGTSVATGRMKIDESKEQVTRADIGHAPVRVRSSAIREAQQAQREKGWREEGVYRSTRRKPPQEFIESEMSEGHRREVENLLSTPGSPFTRGFEGQQRTTPGRYAPGVRRRLGQYTDRLQEGYSHEDALKYLTQERRGRRPARAAPQPTGATPKTQRVPAQRGKYESAKPRAQEMQVGISAHAIDSASTLRDRFPDRSEREIVQIQQSQRQSVYDELLHNQKWAHETKRANILGDKGDTQEKKSDRVVFFTTSLGGPAPSVPSDSLVGQYIIRKRKDMMKDAGVSGSQLRGEFPRAVRDMHIFEWSTGVSYGVEGRQGAYKQTGFRNRNKASRGYGRPRPVGSNVIYGSDGRPVYDNNGNIRYSEGATRTIDWQSPQVGLRIFIG